MLPSQPLTSSQSSAWARDDRLVGGFDLNGTDAPATRSIFSPAAATTVMGVAADAAPLSSAIGKGFMKAMLASSGCARAPVDASTMPLTR